MNEGVGIVSLPGKKHLLADHVTDVEGWWLRTRGGFSQTRDGALIFFIAYERWLNNRSLLTEEDKVETAKPAEPPANPSNKSP